MKDFLKLNQGEVGIECRFATYVKPPEAGLPDLHLVKEQVHKADGTVVPVVKPVYNYERPYWIVKKGYRNFEQPKEWIEKERVNEFHSTQGDLLFKAASSLGKPYFKKSIKDLAAESPYLFGIDIKSTAVIKNDYMVKYPDLKTEYSVGVFDTETDVIHGTEEIIMATFSFGKICFTAVQKSFFKGVANPEQEVLEKTNKYLEQYITARGIKPVLVIVDSEIDVLIETFKVIHEAKPDFLSIWNMKFDIGKILEACDRANFPVEHLMCDPSVPNEYRSFKFILGPNQKKTASGLVMPIKPAAQWHTVKCPASFYVIDAMCAYKHTRMGEQEKKSYSLDFILGEELNLSKLKFEEADEYAGLAWHVFMQTYYKVEYAVYNIFDCIGVELLDEKTKDLQLVISTQSRASEYTIYNSQPRRLVDDFYFFCRDRGYILGSCSNEMVHELDAYVVGMIGHIVTLPSHQTVDNGVRAIKELPDVRTYIRRHVADLD